MKKIILFVTVLLFSVFWLSAQNSEQLSINNIQTAFTKNGGLYQSDTSWAEFKIKNAQETVAIFAGSLWMGGYKNSMLHLAAQTYYQGSSSDPNLLQTDFQAGPISNNYQDSAYRARYSRVWKISQQQIDDHRNNYSQINYVVPPAIADWPAHGDTSRGEAFHLAPFIDWNGNKLYEPELGEFPDIRGDEAVYVIYNDDLTHILTQANSLEVEIHLMAYAFEAPQDTALHNSIFLHYRIHNPGTEAIDSLTVAHWNDPDLGNPFDDLIGSDSTLGLSYFYNANNNDRGSSGFGTFPPAVGMLFLGTDAAGSGYYTNRSGSSPNAITNPFNAAEFHRYMKQIWKDGSPMVIENPSGLGNTSNGDGYSPAPSNMQSTRWAYNDIMNWYESPARQADKLMLLSAPTQNLPAGGDLCFDLAVIYARDSIDSSPYSSVSKLKRMSAGVKQFFSTQNYVCMNSNIGMVEYHSPELRLFPNPVKEVLILESNSALSKVEIYSLTGERLQSTTLSGNGSHHISLSGKLNAGLYLCTVHFASGETLSRKIMVQ